MPSAFRRLEFALCLAVTTTFVPATSLAQDEADFVSRPTDIFSSIQQDLSEAADRSLASVLANQAWMNSPDSPSGPDDQPIEETSIVKVRAALERVNKLKPILEPI